MSQNKVSPHISDLEKDRQGISPPEPELYDRIYEGYIVIGDLPSGSFSLLILNAVVSLGIPLLGFVVCYSVHQTHAAKFGSLIGLALTIFLFGASIHPHLGQKVSGGLLGADVTQLEPNWLGDHIDSLIAQFVLVVKFDSLLELFGSLTVANITIIAGVLLFVWSLYHYVQVKTEEQKLLKH